MYCYQLDCYERAIREPHQQYGKEIINCYVHLSLEEAKNAPSFENARHVYLRMIKTFEEVLCDDLLSQEWRHHSYRVFKQVKPVLYEVLEKPNYLSMCQRFESLATYFIKDKTSQLNDSKG